METTKPLTANELEMAVDLFQAELLEDEMNLSISDLHDLFDPNQLILDSVETALGPNHGRTWAELVVLCNSVAITLDAEAQARRFVAAGGFE